MPFELDLQYTLATNAFCLIIKFIRSISLENFISKDQATTGFFFRNKTLRFVNIHVQKHYPNKYFVNCTSSTTVNRPITIPLWVFHFSRFKKRKG